MDIDLFEGILLAFLAVGVVLLGALLATLGGIRKALERRPAETSAGASHLTSAVEPTISGTSQAAAASDETPVTAAAEAGGGRAESIRSVLEQHGLADEPATGYSGGGGASVVTPAAAEPEPEPVQSAFAAHADDPQEEPFQRDGRWWFRRGDELLLYDEASGQWLPAPDSAAPAASQSGAATQPVTSSTAQAAGTATATEATPVVADQVSTFWKCPTCGAVNGSTAATCRMCFASRP